MTNTEQSPSAVGDLIRQLRASRHVTQEELAERVPGGVSVDTISNIERGRVRPRRHTLLSILDALEIEAEERKQLLDAWRTQQVNSGTVAAAVTRLPAPATPLIGRERELSELGALIRDSETRVVTLTGPGGVGKTRLAIAAAVAAQDEFADGCVFADLTPLREPDQLLALLAFTLGLADFGDRPMQERIIALLSERELLVVLDNAETAAASSAHLPPVIEACPGLKLLVTSREALRLRAEHEFAVAPLELPPAQQEQPNTELASVPSVELLLQRARMVSPGFTLTEENASSITRICSRLDGLPLALELAAARFRHLSVDALAARLDHALSLLVEGPRDLPERQRTLRAAIDWSHEQLSEAEQILLRRLSVFVDGFSDAAAAEVCGLDAGSDAARTDEALYGLLDKNLLVMVQTQDRTASRYRMLETIREYAAERLRQSGEETTLRERHARFFSGLAEASFAEMYSPRRLPWIEALRLEYGNLLAALSWTLDDAGDKQTGLVLAGSLGRFWYFSGHLNDGRQWLRKALEAGTKGEPSFALARVFYSAGKLAWVQGDISGAVPHAEKSVEASAVTAPELFLAESLTLLGYTLISVGKHEDAIPAFEQALEIERRLEAQWQVGFTLAMFSEALRLVGRVDEATQALDEALSIFRSIEDPWGQGVSLAMTAGIYGDRHEDAEAEHFLDMAEAALSQVATDRYTKARMAIARGYLNLRLGRLPQAAELFSQALRHSMELGQTAYILVALAGIASLAAINGMAREAASLYAFASPVLDVGALHVDDGAVMAREAYTQCFEILKTGLPQDELDAASQRGQNLSIEAAVQLAESVVDQPTVAPR